jgi:hypothetical protein
VEQPLPVALEDQGADPCHSSQTKPSAATGEYHTPAGSATVSNAQQAVAPPVLTTASAVPQQPTSAAEVVVASQQQPPWPTHSNTINIRLELGAAAQHCCDCRQQSAISAPRAGRKQQQHSPQAQSSPAGVPQLLPSNLPAPAGQLGLQSSHPVQHTSQPSHVRSSDHHAADGADKQLGWPPIWTMLPLHMQNQQVLLRSDSCGMQFRRHRKATHTTTTWRLDTWQASHESTVCPVQGRPCAARHILVCLESVHILDAELLYHQGVTSVVVAYCLLPELCPAAVQQTEQLRLSNGPMLPCSHARVRTLPCTPCLHARTTQYMLLCSQAS